MNMAMAGPNRARITSNFLQLNVFVIQHALATRGPVRVTGPRLRIIQLILKHSFYTPSLSKSALASAMKASRTLGQ